jgi:hypothetical protein
MGRLEVTGEERTKVFFVPKRLEPEKYVKNLGLGLFSLLHEGKPKIEFTEEDIKNCRGVRFTITKKGAELFNWLRPNYKSERELVRCAIAKLRELPPYARKRII